MESLIKKIIDSKDDMELYQRCLHEVFLRYKPDHCLIAEYNLEHRTAQTRCYLVQGKLADNIRYSLGGTPCEEVLDSVDICIYESQIQQQFPQDEILQVIDAQSYLGIPIQSRTHKVVGVIALMYNTDLPNLSFDKDWLETLGYLIGKTILQQRLGHQKDHLLNLFDRSEQLTNSGSWTWDVVNDHLTCSHNLIHLLTADHPCQFCFDSFFSHYIFQRLNDFEHFKAQLLSKKPVMPVTVFKEMSSSGLQLEISYSRNYALDGTLIEIVGNIKNVTDISELEAEFSLAQKVIDLSPNGVLITDKYNRIIKCNTRVESITGYSAQELEGKTPGVLSSNLHPAEFYYSMWSSIQKDDLWKGEVWNQTKSGAVYPEQLSVFVLRNYLGEVQNYIGIFEDISLQKSIENELSRYKNQCDFTGLMKRDKFINQLEHDHERTIVIVDIKRFSSYNNMYGESFGNKLLIHVGQLLHSNFNSDTVNICRYGADQFALSIAPQVEHLLPQLIDRLKHVIESPFSIDNHAIELMVNIGYSAHLSNIDTHPIKQAYYALTHAKKATTTATIAYSHQLEQQVTRRHDLSIRLKKAIQEKNIDVAYQAIYDLETDSVVKLEALARWNDGNESIPPHEFIPIAEEFGYIFQLGQLVLERACHDLVQLKQLGFDQISISVNRSIDELSQESLTHCSIIEIIRHHGLNDGDIVIEVTESIPLDGKPHVQELLKFLRLQGVQVALDDFGTGYASFSNLMKNTIDILKIDRSFIVDIEHNQDNVVLIQSLNLLAKQLGLTVIAEGIETAQQLEILRRLNCRYIQGYFISKPKRIEDIIIDLGNTTQ